MGNFSCKSTDSVTTQTTPHSIDSREQLEEPQTTQAARRIVSDGGLPSSSKKSVSFNEEIQQHLFEPTGDEDKANLWYTPEEKQSMAEHAHTRKSSSFDLNALLPSDRPKLQSAVNLLKAIENKLDMSGPSAPFNPTERFNDPSLRLTSREMAQSPEIYNPKILLNRVTFLLDGIKKGDIHVPLGGRQLRSRDHMIDQLETTFDNLFEIVER